MLPRMRTRRGYSLIELIIVLALLALAIGLAYPGARAAADGWAVRAARDATASVLASTRAAAVAHRGAELLVVQATGEVLTRTARSPRPLPRLSVTTDWGVALSSPGFAGDTVSIRYDALGLGRVASRTLRFERGASSAGITVSAYGRIRRW
ncbi:MAG TPA: prepilin-type N-terminal cleavage/methylation domain-containing protein [Longimicrobiales bacterium]|nr:prepilin-type N-terminal cleavage/methylation domain-containing protein [Longimicrobiales bacterium]